MHNRLESNVKAEMPDYSHEDDLKVTRELLEQINKVLIE